MQERVEVAKLLLANGANLNAKNKVSIGEEERRDGRLEVEDTSVNSSEPTVRQNPR